MQSLLTHMQLCVWLNTTAGAQVATLGKSGVSVGYYDTEENAARAYDRAAIGLLGRDNCSITTNFPLGDYDEEIVPQLIGKTREEVKTTLKNERAKVSAVFCIEWTLNPELAAGQMVRLCLAASYSQCSNDVGHSDKLLSRV